MLNRVMPYLPVIALAFVTPARASATPIDSGSFVLDGGEAESASALVADATDPCALSDEDARPPTSPVTAAPLAAAAAAAAQTAPAPRAIAFEYSEGYRTRLKIHKYASYATLPIFVAQYVVGQKLYNGNTSDSMRSAHSALVAGTAVLFGVNTVTGVWNLAEGRKDPNHKTKRMVHGFLMLAADAGFVATGLMAPHTEHESGFESISGSSPSSHRAVALTSMGVATVSYLMMLFH